MPAETELRARLARVKARAATAHRAVRQADPDETVNGLICAVDATLDQAQALLAGAGTLPPDAQQAQALLTAADAVLDDLMELLGIPDPDEMNSQTPRGSRAAPKPYGNVTYADPKNGKYPIDTKEHADAAWKYINMPKNAAKYPMNGVSLSSVKSRIMAACKKFGITVSQANAAHFAPDLDVVRSGGGLELAAAGDGSLGTLAGRFTEFGRWYPVSSVFEGDFMERVKAGATLDTIRDNRDSMRVLFDHGTDRQIGNKVLGPIEVLEEKSDGAHYEVPLFDTSYNRDLLPGLKAGVYGASMRMRVTGDSWDDDPARSDGNPDGIPERTITRMKVLEFGPVTFPANPGASAGVRSATDEFYGRLAGVNPPAFEDALRACGLSIEDFTGRDGRSAPGGAGRAARNGGPSPNPRTALRGRTWLMRRQLHG